MNFGNEDVDSGLEARVEEQDIFQQLDSKFIKEESASQTVIKRMFLSSSLVDKTDLHINEIPDVLKLMFVSDRFKLGAGKKICNMFFALRVSKDRLGRTEGFNAVASENEVKAKSSTPSMTFLGGRMPTL